MAAAVAHPDLFGFIVREVATGAVIVSIRGTLVPEEWLRNFTVIPAEYLDSAELRHRPPRLPARLRQRPGEPRARPCGRTRNTRITVLGHSLGGAMATVAGPDIKRNLKQQSVDVCTFGGPRVGKPDFRGKFDAEIARCYRVTNQFDIVPQVPTIVTGWMHVGEAVEVDGNLDDAHSLPAYLAGLRAISVPNPGLTARVLERRGLMSAVVP